MQKSTYKNQTGGLPNGYMDIYCASTNEVWEVKRNNSRGISAGNAQISKYINSYVSASLFTKRTIKPRVGANVSGIYYVSEGIWDITFWWSGNGLILYDYKANPGRTSAACAVILVGVIISVASAGTVPSWAVAFA